MKQNNPPLVYAYRQAGKRAVKSKEPTLLRNADVDDYNVDEPNSKIQRLKTMHTPKCSGGVHFINSEQKIWA